MLEALYEHLLENWIYMWTKWRTFLYYEFEQLVSTYSISRAFRSQGWTKKVARRIAQERNADLRDHYLHQLSDFRSYHPVFIDESGCVRSKRAGFKKIAWELR